MYGWCKGFGRSVTREGLFPEEIILNAYSLNNLIAKPNSDAPNTRAFVAEHRQHEKLPAIMDAELQAYVCNECHTRPSSRWQLGHPAPA